MTNMFHTLRHEQVQTFQFSSLNRYKTTSLHVNCDLAMCVVVDNGLAITFYLKLYTRYKLIRFRLEIELALCEFETKRHWKRMSTKQREPGVYTS